MAKYYTSNKQCRICQRVTMMMAADFEIAESFFFGTTDFSSKLNYFYMAPRALFCRHCENFEVHDTTSYGEYEPLPEIRFNSNWEAIIASGPMAGINVIVNDIL